MSKKNIKKSQITHFIRTDNSRTDFENKKLFSLFLINNYIDNVVSFEINDDECYCEVNDGNWINDAIKKFPLFLRKEKINQIFNVKETKET